MTKQEEIINTIKVLRKEVEVLTTRLKPNGTGYLHTAIGVINDRIDELIKEVTAPFFAEEEDIYGNLEGQARLRRIQDSAAGRKPNKVRDAYLWSADKEGHWSPDDDVKHTKEYYDKDRNRGAMSTANAESLGSLGETIRPMEGEDLPVKRKMTVSEQMQEELEPLPINTFT